MGFRGNIATFNPPDLLMFLSHMDKEGMLSVTREQETLSILIKEGMIMDAHSAQGDQKLLSILFMSGRIKKNQLAQLRQIQSETGIPVRQIFEKLNPKLIPKLQKELQACIMEVLFQFCLLKRGEFQFIDTPVELPPGMPVLSYQSIVLELTSQVDDWFEMTGKIGSLDQKTKPGEEVPPPEKLSGIELLMFKAVSSGKTVAQLIELLPLPSFRALKSIHEWASRGWLRFIFPDHSSQETSSDDRGEDRLLLPFKQAYRQMLSSDDVTSKTKRIIAYCKEQFEHTVLLSAEDRRLNHCTIFSIDSISKRHMKKERSLDIPLESEPVFEGVLRSGRAFFGELFPSELLNRILPGLGSGACALMLLQNSSEHTSFLFVFSAKISGDITPFHYLELLSWLIAPPKTHADIPADAVAPTTSQARKKGIDEIVSHMNDLPPMPHNVTRILQMLASPDKSMQEVAAILGEDQAMVARLLKVSNSVLYRTGEEIRTLKHALARLGTKTIRNLVLSSSTQAMFPMDQSALGIWSRSLWQHAKECALSARCVARILGYADPEEAFAGGILHDVGKLVILLKYTNEFRRIRKKQTSENISSTMAERSILQFDHTQAGQILMEKWQMPPILNACVRYHHSPEEAGEFTQIAHIVSYADYLANRHGTNATQIPDAYDKELEAIQRILKVDNETAKQIETAVISDLKQADIFD